jgi:hypothetical protein
MVGAAFLYIGIVAVLVGLGWLGVRWIRGRSRRPGNTRRPWILAGLGGVFLLTGYFLPAPLRRVAAPVTRLDAFVPAWQFNEFHELRVSAPPARVYAAINAVRAGDIRFYDTLTWIRRFGRPAPESILAPSAQRPILDVATTTGFLRLADEPDREIVIGVVLPVRPGGPPLDPAVRRRPETFMAPHQSGLCLVGMNFLIRPDGAHGSVLSTETRIFATDATARRAFATYWRTIYPGSAIIRWMWLRAIRERAEQS